MENLTGKELFKALGDLGKRIPVVKLERVETFYPTVKNAQKTVVSNSVEEHWIYVFNLLKPNDIYICCTAALTSRRYILNIYSTNIHIEYFKQAA